MAVHPYYRIAMGLRPIAMKEPAVNFKSDFQLDSNHHKPYNYCLILYLCAFINITFEKYHPDC